MHYLTGMVILLLFRLGNKCLLVLIAIIFCFNSVTDLCTNRINYLSSAEKEFGSFAVRSFAPRLKQDDVKLAAIF